MELGRQAGAHTWRSLALYVATPEAAQRFGFDLAAARADTDVLTPNRNRLEFLGSVPTVLFVLERMLRHEPVAKRWLLSALGPGFTAAFMTLERR